MFLDNVKGLFQGKCFVEFNLQSLGSPTPKGIDLSLQLAMRSFVIWIPIEGVAVLVEVVSGLAILVEAVLGVAVLVEAIHFEVALVVANLEFVNWKGVLEVAT